MTINFVHLTVRLSIKLREEQLRATLKFCKKHLKIIKQQKIRIIGGKSAENHLVSCLVTTLTNQLAKLLTWDQRKTEGIKDTTFVHVIMGTISNMYVSATLCSLKNKFAEWLRRAGDRHRYHEKLGRNT
ncbi:PREDICTED: uncharacterized protein LOC105460453 isoform X2 [Wasmannia auropunctata]|uniref:uncharacterized protein LOC105460453 isoform X2 n=1 Tax=Wasmannia auropunctata TaxID=64793 RepID=UPI0005EDE8A7|nr:PREDICTED: uncharacterized protein LOC105460453 isoform X2 [Wasmannia auropunctata]